MAESSAQEIMRRVRINIKLNCENLNENFTSYLSIRIDQSKRVNYSMDELIFGVSVRQF